MLGVRRCEKGALVMIEPPGKQRRARILEIHNGVLVAVEHPVFEWLGRLVGHARIKKLRVRVNAFAIKPRENCGGAGSVETFVVKANANSHQIPLCALRKTRMESQLEWTDYPPGVNSDYHSQKPRGFSASRLKILAAAAQKVTR